MKITYCMYTFLIDLDFKLLYFNFLYLVYIVFMSFINTHMYVKIWLKIRNRSFVDLTYYFNIAQYIILTL